MQPLLDWLFKNSSGGGQNQESDAHGQKNFPAYFHELVEAITRERATTPDIEVHEPGNFRGEPENVSHTVAHAGNKHDQSNHSQHHAESRQPDCLNPEQRMLGHSRRVEEANRSEEKESEAGNQPKGQIPSRTVQ